MKGDGRFSEYVICLFYQSLLFWRLRYIVYCKSSHICFNKVEIIFYRLIISSGVSPEPQNLKECFHGSSQIVGKCHIICDFFWNISRWSAKTPKYQGSLNSPSLLTFKISLSDLQWIMIVSRWVAKTPLVLGRFSRSSAKLQNFQFNSTDYRNAEVSLIKSNVSHDRSQLLCYCY